MKIKKNTLPITAFLVLIMISNFGSFTYKYLNGESDFLMTDLFQTAIAQTEGSGGTSSNCFNKTKYKCTLPIGREAQDCNTTGNYKAGEECSLVQCLSPNTRKTCVKPT